MMINDKWQPSAHEMSDSNFQHSLWKYELTEIKTDRWTEKCAIVMHSVHVQSRKI